MFIQLLSLFVSLILPTMLCVSALVLEKRRHIFLLGCVSFIVSQLVLRLPLLAMMSRTTSFVVWQVQQPILSGMLIAFSAGVFEETGRLVVAKKYLSSQLTWKNALWFGLGHAWIEVIIFFSLPILYQMSLPESLGLEELVLASLERLSAMTLHVALTVFIFFSLANMKKRFYFLALISHSVIDSLPLLFPRIMTQYLVSFEVLLSVVCLLLFGYSIFLKRTWKNEEAKKCSRYN